MDNKKQTKKRVIPCIIAIVAFVGIVAAVLYFMNKDGGDKDTDKDINVSETQRHYNSLIEVISKAKMLTVFDDVEAPINNIYAATHTQTSADAQTTTGEDTTSVEVTNTDLDIIVDILYYDKKTQESMGYTIFEDEDGFNYAKEKGKEKKLSNDQVVYVLDGGYYWHDEETGLYQSLYSFSEEKTTSKDLEQAIVTAGKSKINLFDLLGYGKGEKLVEPTKMLEEDSTAAPETVILSYTMDNNGVANSDITSYYMDFVIFASRTSDYTEGLDENTDTLKVKELSNKVKVYYDTESNAAQLTTDDKLSVIVQGNSGEVKTEEMMKVVEGLKFK